MSLDGYAGVAMINLVLLFESGIFSIIFAMCIRGLGARTKFGSVVLTASTAGGAVIPALMSPVVDRRGLQYGFAVVVAVFAFGALLPIYVCTVPAAKDQVDPVHEKRASRRSHEKEHPASTSNRASRIFRSIRRRNKDSSDVPSVEHVESDKAQEPG